MSTVEYVVVEEVVEVAVPVIVEKAGEFIVANAGTLGAVGAAAVAGAAVIGGMNHLIRKDAQTDRNKFNKQLEKEIEDIREDCERDDVLRNNKRNVRVDEIRSGFRSELEALKLEIEQMKLEASSGNSSGQKSSQQQQKSGSDSSKKSNKPSKSDTTSGQAGGSGQDPKKNKDWEFPQYCKLRVIMVYILAGMIQRIARVLGIQNPIYGGCYDEVMRFFKKIMKILMSNDEQATSLGENALEVHHFGAAAAYDNTVYANIPYNAKLGILMTLQDHLRTRSHGNSEQAQNYRVQLRNALLTNGMAGMFRVEINAFFEDGILIRYAYAIIQMLNRGREIQFYNPETRQNETFLTEQEYRELIELVLNLFRISYENELSQNEGTINELIEDVDEYLEHLDNLAFDEWLEEYIKAVWDAPENYKPKSKRPVRRRFKGNK